MTESTNDNLPTVVTESTALADMSRISAVTEQIAVIRTLLSDHMKEGEDYGKIPGIEKPTLLKPGGEKIMLLFNSYAEYEEELTDLGNGHREYKIKARITSRDTGKILAVGIGSCSTMEKKYRYRNEKIASKIPVPKSYWDKSKSADQKKDILRQHYGGDANKLGTLKTDVGWVICELVDGENPDIADSYNTCLKIAKKRAMIDGVISTGTCSHLFTQDVEDMQKDEPKIVEKKEVKEPTKPKHFFAYYVDELDDKDKQEIWKESKLYCGEYKNGLLWTSVRMSNKWTSILQTSDATTKGEIKVTKDGYQVDGRDIKEVVKELIDAEFVNPFTNPTSFADDELPPAYEPK